MSTESRARRKPPPNTRPPSYTSRPSRVRSRRVRPKPRAQALPTHPRRPDALPLVQHAAIGMEEFTGLGVIRAQINGQRIITPGDHKKDILAIGLFRHRQAKPRGGGTCLAFHPRRSGPLQAAGGWWRPGNRFGPVGRPRCVPTWRYRITCRQLTRLPRKILLSTLALSALCALALRHI